MRRLCADDLHVERTRNLERACDLLRDLLHAVEVDLRQSVRRQNKGSVTGVYTSLLDVLRDGVYNKLAVIRNTIEVDFLCTLDELSDDDRVQRRD